MASLQLLCTVGGNQAKLDARSEFKISQRSPKGGGGEAGVRLSVPLLLTILVFKTRLNTRLVAEPHVTHITPIDIRECP